MNIKLTVEVGESGENDYHMATKVLLLAQKGIIEKYADRLMSAGGFKPGAYMSYGGPQIVYIKISNISQSTEVK